MLVVASTVVSGFDRKGTARARRVNRKFLNTFQSVLYFGVGTGRPASPYLTFGTPL